MTPRKRLEGPLADWYPHPKAANNSLVPVVRTTGPADEIVEQFFDSTPAGYTPEPSAVETDEQRRATDSAAARERRRYLMRYVAAAVGTATIIGVGALVRLTVTRDASAADVKTRVAASNVAFATPAPIASSAAAVEASADSLAPETTPATSARAPSDDATGAALPAGAASAAETAAPPVSPERDPDGARDAKRAAQKALDRGRLSQSIEAGERSIALDPTDAESWLILGAAYQARGSFGDARRCFSSCARLATRGATSECRALLR